MRYSPRAISSALAWAQEEKADLTSLTPRIEMVGFWERVVLPFTVQMILTYFRASSVNRDSSRAAMANGQFYIVRRAAYDAVGGHERIRGVVLEDVQLAREFRAAGLRSRLGWAPELLSTRMYRDRREMFEGLLKNAHDTQFSAARQLGFLVGLVGLFWLPLALLPAGILWHSALWTVLGAVLWIALFGKHAIFAHADPRPGRRWTSVSGCGGVLCGADGDLSRQRTSASPSCVEGPRVLDPSEMNTRQAPVVSASRALGAIPWGPFSLPMNAAGSGTPTDPMHLRSMSELDLEGVHRKGPGTSTPTRTSWWLRLLSRRRRPRTAH